MMPKPWDVAGLDQITYSKLPWPEKREWLVKAGHKPATREEIKAMNEVIERNRPPEGYLLRAYFTSEANRKWENGDRTFAPWER